MSASSLELLLAVLTWLDRGSETYSSISLQRTLRRQLRSDGYN